MASIGSIIMLYMESRMLSVILPRLFVLGFGTLIFVMSYLKYGGKHRMEQGHEKA